MICPNIRVDGDQQLGGFGGTGTSGEVSDTHAQEISNTIPGLKQALEKKKSSSVCFWKQFANSSPVRSTRPNGLLQGSQAFQNLPASCWMQRPPFKEPKITREGNRIFHKRPEMVPDEGRSSGCLGAPSPRIFPAQEKRLLEMASQRSPPGESSSWRLPPSPSPCGRH